MSEIIDLNGIWKLSWQPIEGCADVPVCETPILGRVPGDVHEDLVRAGLLPEPLVGANAPKHEWVERALFTYERELSAEGDFDRAELVFNAVDNFADYYIDSEKIGSSANAFVPHTFDVTSLVKNGESHKLTVNVETGVQWAKKQDRKDYRNDDNWERMFLRKPQFAFKWDWAPRLVNCGLWRDAELKLYKHAALRDVLLTRTFKGAGADVEAKVEIEAFSEGDYQLKLKVSRNSQNWESVYKVSLNAGMNTVELSANVDQVARWFPAGYGEQPLYDISVELIKAGAAVDSYATSYGFRDVFVKQEPTEEGEKTFIINVNGIDVFCKGANWVPADSLYSRVTDEKYEALVKEALEANFNMFRIWGGGIYEDKTFYDLCDRYGIMLWHDFMFACSEVPDDQDWFVDNVREEVAKAIPILRNHPSIALWCGNNENDWIYGYYARGVDGKMGPFFGAKIYSEVIPEACAKYDPQRYYWQSSPFGGDDPNCEAEGDRHAWYVSILEKDPATRADIRNYRKDRGKFNSEYGMMSYALPRTILDYTQEDEINFKSEAYKIHDNSFNSTHEGLSPDMTLTDWYLQAGFGSVPRDEPLAYIYQSMAYQAMGYRESISDFRIRKFDCAGSLFWMYSDCWGTLGWTIIDYYLRRKPSFYWVRKAYSPLAVFVRVEDGVAHTYVVNDRLQEITVTLTLETGNLSGEGQGVVEDIVVPANSTAIGPEIECGKGYAYAKIERGGRVRSDDLILTHFPSEMEIPEVNIDFDTKQVGDHLEVTLKSDGFAHFVYLDLPDEAIPSDNYFNLLPNRPKIIRVANSIGGEISIGALNMKRE